MVEKWTLCIEVSCRPNLGRASLKFVLHNGAKNHVIYRIWEVQGKTTNNEAYYITLVAGLKEAKHNGVNNITVLTNSDLICNHMEGIYNVRADNLKPLYREAKIWSARFNSFSIKHVAEIHKISTDLMVGAISSVDAGARDDSGSSFIPLANIDQHQYRSRLCVYTMVVIFIGILIPWFFQ